MARARARRFLRIAPALGATVLIAGISSPAGAERPQRAPGSGDGGVKLTDLGDFDSPVYAATAPGRANRKLLFVVEQDGAIRSSAAARSSAGRSPTSRT